MMPSFILEHSFPVFDFSQCDESCRKEERVLAQSWCDCEHGCLRRCQWSGKVVAINSGAKETSVTKLALIQMAVTKMVDSDDDAG